MDNLKRQIQGLQIEHENIEKDPDFFEKKMANVKVEVNKLLFNYLPSELTIAEMDAIAMAFVDCIFKPREYLKPKA